MFDSLSHRKHGCFRVDAAQSQKQFLLSPIPPGGIGDKGSYLVPRQNVEIGKTALGTVFLSQALTLSPNLTLNYKCWYYSP